MVAFSCGFMLLVEPDEELPEAITDISASFDRISKKQSDGEDPFLVVIDILISLLSRKSLFLRHIVERAFTNISKYLKADYLSPLFEVILSKPEETEEDGDDDIEIEEDGDDDDDDDIDIDIDEDDDDDDENGDEIDSIIQNIKAKENEKPFVMGDDDINIDEADEEEMKKLDDRLSEYFKIAKTEKRNVVEKKESQEHLKLKVLTLLELYAKKNSKNENVVLLIEPIFKSILDTESNKDLAVFHQKAKVVFEKKLCKMKDLPSLSPEKIELVHNHLNMFITKMTSKKKISPATLFAATHGLKLCLRILLSKKSTDGKEEFALDFEKFNSSISNAITDYGSNKNTSIKSKFFIDLINTFPILCWQSIASLIIDNLIAKGRNDYIITQGCVLLEQLLKKSSPVEEHKTTALKRIFPIFIDIFAKTVPPKRLLVVLKTFGACLSTVKRLTNGDVSLLSIVIYFNNI